MTDFDTIRRPHPWRRRLLLAAWLVAIVVLCVRAGQVQILQASQWRKIAESQHRTDAAIAAPRGTILDRDGTPLAVSRERFRVSFATREVSDLDRTRTILRQKLGVSAGQVRALTSSSRTWSVVPGLYPPAVRDEFDGIRGVRLDREFERYYPHGEVARGVLGRVLEGKGNGGLEQAFEDLLSGVAGREVVARDNLGRPIPGERLTVEPPVAGGEIVLTLDMDLQEIAQQALDEAIETTGASGGDVLITDPMTGEVLALVSNRDGKAGSLSAVHTPFEPGSTLKPFTVAGLLTHDLADLDDTIDVGGGSWTVEGRVLHDDHAEGVISLGEALRVSSNIGIAKAAQAMSHGTQFENLRDFGFGLPTGIELPGESGGVLRHPDGWSAQSGASLAIGYEISVTPLQIAMAYGALANGGLLMQPRLVREVRAADGSVMERTQPRVVRRVVPKRVARLVSQELVGVVEEGTGTSARLATFHVAGKSGTARAYSGSGYEPGAYYSSFVGFFPAEDPQLVIFVKLERPQGSYYGGAVAAPVTRATMEAALAARATPLDRAALVRAAIRTTPAAPPPTIARFAGRPIDPPAPSVMRAAAAPDRGARLSFVEGVALPDVTGLPSRIAVRRLHALGLRVTKGGAGEILGTVPAAGAPVLPGDTIRLRLRPRTDD